MDNQKQITIALAQMQASSDLNKNLQRAIEKIKFASEKGAHIICLQELFLTPYFPQTEDNVHFQLAESIPGPTTEALALVAREHHIAIIAPLFEKRTQGLYHNSAILINAEGKLAGHYRKMHIPDDPCFYEKFYFSPGDLGFKAMQTNLAKIGILICWDQWFPEAARITALEGAQILFYPTAIAYDITENEETVKQQHNAWETIQRSHAIANGVFVASVNRVGCERNLRFWGSSFVCDPFGNMLQKADTNNEELLIVSCDLDLIEQTRLGWPFLRDRRIDAYDAIYNRYIDS